MHDKSKSFLSFLSFVLQEIKDSSRTERHAAAVFMKITWCLTLYKDGLAVHEYDQTQEESMQRKHSAAENQECFF